MSRVKPLINAVDHPGLKQFYVKNCVDTIVKSEIEVTVCFF